MRKNHTLTFNETTYTINDGNRINDIFINGQKTDWYIEYEAEEFDGIFIPKLILVKNRNDDNHFLHYGAINTTTLDFNSVVKIINIIEENSFRNN
jgi:hypothetical protein